jgi:hypothetical protein
MIVGVGGADPLVVVVGKDVWPPPRDVDFDVVAVVGMGIWPPPDEADAFVVDGCTEHPLLPHV